MTKRKSALAPGIQKPSEDWTAVAEAYEDEYAFAVEIVAAEALEPQNLAEAKGSPDWLLWEKGIEEELKLLHNAGTWELVQIPKDTNIVGSKWVFKAKKDVASTVV